MSPAAWHSSGVFSSCSSTIMKECTETSLLILCLLCSLRPTGKLVDSASRICFLGEAVSECRGSFFIVKKLACTFAGLLAFAGNAMGEVIIGPGNTGNTYVFDFNLTYSRPSNSLDANCALVSFSPSFQS